MKVHVLWHVHHIAVDEAGNVPHFDNGEFLNVSTPDPPKRQDLFTSLSDRLQTWYGKGSVLPRLQEMIESEER
ncbi:hypothetical protein ACWEPL_34275 [Nonomuraea sp. NPDC004186]